MMIGHSTAFHPVKPREVGNGAPCLVVAELGLNHNGSLETALAMVRAVHDTGVRAVKVQAFDAEEFTDTRETYTYQQVGLDGKMETITELQRDLFKRCELGFGDFQAIRDLVRSLGMYWLATATDSEWIRRMMNLGVDALKVGSDDITHTPLLRTLKRAGVPVVLSTGMANAREIKDGIAESGAGVVLHCVSRYPTPSWCANIGRMDALRAFGVPVGYSDHTRGVPAASVAISRGAAILEKHFTLNRRMPGPDHWFSGEAEEFSTLAAMASFAHAVSKPAGLEPSPEEQEMAKVARRSIVAREDINAFRVIGYDDLAYKRPGTGMLPSQVDRVVGLVAAAPIPAGAQVTEAALVPLASNPSARSN